MTENPAPRKRRERRKPYRPYEPLRAVPKSQARTIKPGEISKDRARAVIAVSQGVANEEQQKTAIEAILVDICGYHDLSYRPDELGGERDTSFALGKRFVAIEILRLIQKQGTLLKED